MEKEPEKNLFPPDVINDVLSWLPIKTTECFFPLEIITEILSRLPVKSLARLQLVCKEWKTLIHSPYVNEKLMDHTGVTKYLTTGLVYYDVPTKPSEYFHLINGCGGLLLVRRRDCSSKHFLWNQTINLFLELPDPHKNSYGFAFSYVPTTRNYKLVSIYDDNESGFVRCEIFIPGQSKVWRRCSTFPDIMKVDGKKKIEEVSVVLSGLVVYCILLFKVGNHVFDSYFEKIVLSLDLGNECSTIITPLPNHSFNDWKRVLAVDWNGKLAFTNIVGQNLQVMILEDYKNHKWSKEKKIIPLPAGLNHFKIMFLFPLFAKEGDVWFYLEVDHKIFTYTITSGSWTNILRSRTFSRDHKIYGFKPSLVTFEGMVSDIKSCKTVEQVNRASPSPFSFHWVIYFACLVALPKCIHSYIKS